MELIEITKKFNSQAKCLEYLEKLRWGKTVICPYCDSKDNRPIKTEAGRHSCKNCKRSFSVLVDTIFESSRMPLPQWFMIIGLFINNKSGIAAKEIERNLGITYKTAYYALMRLRIGMLIPNTQLDGIIEMDESYFGGAVRKKAPVNTPTLSSVTTKRGRATNKVSVAGMVERGGWVKTKVIAKLTKRNLLAMLKKYAKEDTSILVTDKFASYKNLDTVIEHLTINHSKSFSKGVVHINTIEGFWAYVKNGIKGNYKAISPKYLPFYLVEYEWKYNHRNYRGKNIFETYLKNALKQEKELEYWKAQTPAQVKQIAYE